MMLPTGTVTFLFTDIEGSTRLMQELGDAYVTAQVEHHKILRAAFRDGKGRELRTEGDSFFAVFESAVDACVAAAKAQRDFASQQWPQGKPMRVRIGMHTGEAPLIGEEYIGLDVHHAARVAASAHGGEVVISEATESLVEHSLPAGLTLRDLGLHRLKDLARPERLFQLVIEGAQDAFPALRTLESTPNNLPTQLTSFVGRERDVEEAKRLLHGTRLLTLTGPGGIGKTRLSLQLAADVVHEFHDGVYFVPLSAVRNKDLIASVIALSIGVAVSGDRGPEEVVHEYLRDRKVLLILDNFEQLLPDGAQAVSRLLHACPQVRVVVSSRAPLRVYGEQEDAVDALPRPEAVQLFIERAVAAKPDFQLTAENSEGVAAICARVDGLPLAIELAAARIKLFNPQALLARLDSSLSVLTSGSRDLPDRQQTLKGAIAWSYDLLDEPHRRLFSRFSVFARGGSLEQAEEVCGPASELGLDVLLGLDELADQSLLRRQPDLDEPRMLMLQVIREYASEVLQAGGEADEVRDRHAAAFQRLAEKAAANLFGTEQKTWLNRLELDHDNFRAAFDWSIHRGDAQRAADLAAAFWRFWHMRGGLREGRARLDAILAMPGARDDPALRAKALEVAGGVAYWLGDMVASETYYGEALELARAAGDPKGIANALYNAAFPLLVTERDLARARKMLEEALPIYRTLGDERGYAHCLWGLGQMYFRMDDNAAAVVALDETIDLFVRLGDRFGLGWAHFARGSLAFRIQDPATAKSHHHAALRIFADADDVSGAVLVLTGLAGVARLEGDNLRAARLAGASEGLEATSGAGLGSAVSPQQGWRPTGALSAPEEVARQEGRAMTLEQAIEYGLSGEPDHDQLVGHA